MIYYQILFGPYVKEQYEDAKNLIENYLSAMSHNGQIVGEWDIVPWQSQIVAYVNTSGIKAERKNSHSKWGKEYLKKIQNFFGQAPVWTCQEDFPRKKNATWKNAPFLYLFTDFSEYESPVARGDNGYIIPYFTIPLTDEEKEWIYFWKERYGALDFVWISSGDLEMPAYRILAEPESEISKSGRELCQTIEKATGVPTYYYLMRYYGRKEEDEKKRLCPCCEKPWYVEHPEGEDKPFWKFDFQCEPCRLVSNLACDVNLRYAKIGEPRQTPSKK